MYWPPVPTDPREAKAMKEVLDGTPPGVAITPLLMGIIIDSVFLGLLFSQLIHWVGHQRTSERKVIRIAVYWSSTMGVLVWILSTGWILYLFGFNYGRWAPFVDYRWLSFYPIVDAAMICVVQVFYAERAYKISGRAKTVIALTVVPLFVSLVGGVGVLVIGLTQTVNSTYLIFVWLWIGGTCTADLVITAIVLWGLMRSRSEWEQTDRLVKRLIRIACESQLPPTIIALALVFDVIAQRDSYYGVFFEMIQGKVYVVGMVYVLNQRFYMRREIDDQMVAFRPTNQFSMQNTKTRPTRIAGPATIHVQTETYVETHQINPAFMPHKIQPKIREASESGETEMSELGDGVNQSEVGLNSEYMERVRQERRKPEFNIASFAAMG